MSTICLQADASTLAAFNTRWAGRYEDYVRYCPVPIWTPHLRMNALLHDQYERFLPIEQFRHDLSVLLLSALPHVSWLPSCLRADIGPYRSIADLWRLLPIGLSGRTTYTLEDVPCLAQALASPARFGTGYNRYPEQETMLEVHFARCGPLPDCLAVDYGCSTGEGTATFLDSCRRFCEDVTMIGVTPEPLEIWLALRDGRSEIHYVCGSVMSTELRRPIDVAICNGLIGGPYLWREHLLRDLARRLPLRIKTGGLFVFGDRFHAGRQRHVAYFCEQLRAAGHKVETFGGSHAVTMA